MRTIQTLGGVAALIAVAVYWNFGTLSPCGMLRESVRQRDGLAAVLPDSIVDLALAGQYGELSPGRCLTILMNNLSTPVPNTAQASRPQTAQPVPRPAPQPAPVTAQDPMQWAAQVTVQASNECRAKRLHGELPNHVASVQCANAPMLAAFSEAHYRYMDLIQFFAAKRLELAAKIDRGELTEQQAQLDGNKIYASIQETERRRDAAARAMVLVAFTKVRSDLKAHESLPDLPTTYADFGRTVALLFDKHPPQNQGELETPTPAEIKFRRVWHFYQATILGAISERTHESNSRLSELAELWRAYIETARYLKDLAPQTRIWSKDETDWFGDCADEQSYIRSALYLTVPEFLWDNDEMVAMAKEQFGVGRWLLRRG